MPKSFSPKSHHNNKCYGGNERKNEEEHEELKDLDPRGSPHLEEKVIGGNVDLDLLSLFPQEGARIIGGLER